LFEVTLSLFVFLHCALVVEADKTVQVY